MIIGINEKRDTLNKFSWASFSVIENVTMKKEVRKAMEKAKELEKIPVPTKQEIVSIYKDGLEEAEKLRKLLRPEWFMHDTDAKKRKRKK